MGEADDLIESMRERGRAIEQWAIDLERSTPLIRRLGAAAAGVMPPAAELRRQLDHAARYAVAVSRLADAIDEAAEPLCG